MSKLSLAIGLGSPESILQNITLLRRFGEYITNSSPPDFVIGSPEDPYINRWFIHRDRNDSCQYLHRVMRDDDDRALHDHPWDSASIILSGRLREILPGGESRILLPGSYTERKAEDAHRLELVDGPVMTLFITGPKIRDWGFHCPNGWVHWVDFTKKTNPGEVGAGCGEA